MNTTYRLQFEKAKIGWRYWVGYGIKGGCVDGMNGWRLTRGGAEQAARTKAFNYEIALKTKPKADPPLLVDYTPQCPAHPHVNSGLRVLDEFCIPEICWTENRDSSSVG